MPQTASEKQLVSEPLEKLCSPDSLKSCQYRAVDRFYNEYTERDPLAFRREPFLTFGEQWLSLNGYTIKDCVVRTGLSILGQSRLRAILNLDLPQERTVSGSIFEMDFIVRTQKDRRSNSPIQLFDTRVYGRKTVDLYLDIMKMIRHACPKDTHLLAYVRQPDSLKVLQHSFQQMDSKTICESVLIIKLFREAGWRFLQVGQHKNAIDPLRQFSMKFAA